MTRTNTPRQPGPRTFPRASSAGPNLATLDRVRGLRRPRLMQPQARRHQVEQECRELVYAARFLKRWRYAPLATLRARFVR